MQLTQEQTEYLGEAIGEPSAIVSRCIEFLKSHGLVAQAAWTDPRQTSTSERHCLQITIGEGHYYGHGDTESLAALNCFALLWYSFVTVPNAPAPSEDEIVLRDSGKGILAIKHYVDRTGEDLGIARHRLGI